MQTTMNKNLEAISNHLRSDLQIYHAKLYNLTGGIASLSVSMVDILMATSNATKAQLESQRNAEVQKKYEVLKQAHMADVTKDQQSVLSVSQGPVGMESLSQMAGESGLVLSTLTNVVTKMTGLRKKFPVGTSFHNPSRYCSDVAASKSNPAPYWIEPTRSPSSTIMGPNRPFQILCDTKAKSMIIARIPSPSGNSDIQAFLSNINQ